MHYGIEPHVFWDLTPAQFVAYTDEYIRREQRKDQRFGVVASVIANVNRDSKKRSKPYTSKDFFPIDGKPENKGMSADDLRSAINKRVLENAERISASNSLDIKN